MGILRAQKPLISNYLAGEEWSGEIVSSWELGGAAQIIAGDVGFEFVEGDEDRLLLSVLAVKNGVIDLDIPPWPLTVYREGESSLAITMRQRVERGADPHGIYGGDNGRPYTEICSGLREYGLSSLQIPEHLTYEVLANVLGDSGVDAEAALASLGIEYGFDLEN